MSPFDAFVAFALPLAEDAIVPLVKAFLQANPHLPVPPSIQPYLDIKARHAAIAAARLEAEKR